MSEDGEYIMRCGIIDFLTEFNLQKDIENKWKSTLHQVHKD